MNSRNTTNSVTACTNILGTNTCTVHVQIHVSYVFE